MLGMGILTFSPGKVSRQEKQISMFGRIGRERAGPHHALGRCRVAGTAGQGAAGVPVGDHIRVYAPEDKDAG